MKKLITIAAFLIAAISYGQNVVVVSTDPEAPNYAKTNTSNTFTGSQIVNGNNTINGNQTVSGNLGVRLKGQAMGWEDTFVPALAITTGSSAPALSTGFAGSSSLQTYYFQGSSVDDQCWFSLQIPHSAMVGDSVVMHVHWTPTTSASAGDTVVWELLYAYQSIMSAFTSPSTILVKTACSVGSQWNHQISNFPSFTNLGISSILICRLRRLANSNGSDTYTSNAALIGIDGHYKINSQGSDGESYKTSTP